MRKFYYLFMAAIFFSAATAFGQDVCQPVGWATQNGGVTGGGNATPVVVDTYSELDDAVDDENVKVIHVSGTITIPSGGKIVFQDQSDKSILGLPGARLVSADQSSGGSGIMQIKRVDNAIIRNITFEGPGAYDVDGNDNLTVEDSRNIWVDHCVFEDGCDGNFDIKSEANYISVTWCVFQYRKPPRSGGPGGSNDHRYSNLIGSSDGATGDRGKLNVTFQYCRWGEGVRERMPRVRYGKVHMVNCLFDSDVSNYCLRAGYEANIRAEGNYFDDQDEPIDLFDGDYTAVYANNNIGQSNMNNGSVFTPPYSLTIADPSTIRTPIINCAGATLDGPDGCSSCGDGGGGTTDCNGDAGGSAYLDDCSNCVGGNTGQQPCVIDCNGDQNGSASLDACGVCSGGNTGVAACAGVVQGEDECSGDGVDEADNSGYQGAGYFNYDNTAGTSATWAINASGSQSYNISVRYANGGTGARPLNVFVNGSQQGTISGNPTGGWTTWVSEAVSVNLNSGYNEITFTATAGEGGPNVDLIALPSGLSQTTCGGGGTPDCNGDIGGSAYLDNCNQCVGGNTGQEPCSTDCNGDAGGSAYLDGCGQCVGGNTGNAPCQTTCDDVGVVFGQTGYSTENGGTTGGAGGDEVTVSNGVDLQNAIKDASGPRIIYIDGTINVANSTGLSKIDIKDVSDISIIGLEGAEFDGIGLKIWRASNIIIQNVTVHHVLTGDKDGLNIEGPSDHIWVDHCEFYNQYQGVDKDYYDALLDLKRDVDNVTISWNYFHDSWKCSLAGSSESDTYNRTVTYHHNFYENINSRLPLFRSGYGHMFNNYYKDIASTTINSRINACVKVENNYFLNAQNPYVSAYSDVVGYGDIEGNILENSPFEYASDVQELGACTASIPYDYSGYLNCAENVPSIVQQYAGVDKELGGNLPPTVNITAPSNGATYDDPATINITANANDSDGAVVSVEFFQNNNSLGTDNSAPYEYSWTGVTAGTYTIKAVVTDDDGATAESSISVTVNAANLDCNGDPNGSAYLDNCNVCVGGNTGLEPCTQDCAGTWGGTEEYDDCGVCGGSNACVDCNGDPNGSATIDGCGICSGGNTGVIACNGSIQAESACVLDGTVDSDNAGFNGSGFANTTNAVGANILLSIDASNSGAADVGFVYANGGGTDRPATLIVNGTTVGTLTLSATGGWETWNVETATIDFNEGLNTIELVATTADGIANLDQLNFTAAGFSAGSCDQDCNGDIAGAAITDACGKCVGGNTGETSDDADGDGILDCEDTYPNDFDNDGVVTGEDCDDNNASVGAGTTWYEDTDNDGIGYTGSQITACTQPAGYVSIGGDNCPNDINKSAPGNCGCGVEEGTCEDCAGVPNGEASYDDCNVCSGGTTGITPNSTCEQDCAGVWGGTAEVDNCEVCAGGTTGITPNSSCEQDCAGIWNGTAEVDDCNVCAGGTTGIAPNSTCEQDCNGEWGGTAFEDNCGNCVASQNEACTQDCFGDWGGTASEDVCGTCTGGNTGVTPITDPQNCVATGIEDLEDSQVNVYPNPSTKVFHIKTEGLFTYKVYTISGVEVEHGQGENEIILGVALVPGTYLLEIISEASNVTIIKIVRQ